MEPCQASWNRARPQGTVPHQPVRAASTSPCRINQSVYVNLSHIEINEAWLMINEAWLMINEAMFNETRPGLMRPCLSYMGQEPRVSAWPT